MAQSCSASSRSAVGQQVEAEHQADDGADGNSDIMRPDGDHGGAFLDHAAPVRIGRRQAEAEKAQDADRDDGVADAQAGIDDQRPAAVRAGARQHDVERALAPQLRRGDVFLILDVQRQAAHDAHDAGRRGERHRDHDVEHRGRRYSRSG